MNGNKSKFKWIMAALVCLGVFFALAPAVYAGPVEVHGVVLMQAGEDDAGFPISTTQLVIWLMASGSSAIVVSFLAERVPFFQKMSGGQKTTVIIVFGVVMAGAGSGVRAVMLHLTTEATDLVNIGFFALLYIGVFVLGSQWFHLSVNQKLKLAQQLRTYVRSLPDALRAAGADPGLIKMAEMIAAMMGVLTLPGEAEVDPNALREGPHRWPAG